MSADEAKVERRGDRFAERFETGIWLEQPSAENPYIASAAYCHGYDLRELMTRCSYLEFVYLLLTGRRCTPDQHVLLQTVAIALANPGPRHPATRAVMAAAVSKTEPAHVLPLGMSVLASAHLGAVEVSDCMHWLRRAVRRDPLAEAASVCAAIPDAAPDTHPVQGFGARFGGCDALARSLAAEVTALPAAGSALAWADRFASALENRHGGGWLMTGLAAAAFLDLDLHPRMGAPLFQWLSAPGLIAHADEMAGKPLTAFQFVEDKNYFIDEQ